MRFQRLLCTASVLAALGCPDIVGVTRQGVAGNGGGTGGGTAGPATHLAFVAAPGTSAAGVTINTVQIAAEDSAGVTDPTFTCTVTVAIGVNPGGGTLSGTTAVAAVSGIATFGDLRIDAAGAGYTLTASAPGLNGTSSSSFNVQ